MKNKTQSNLKTEVEADLEQNRELAKNLKNRRWRLDNLYWIKNDQGERVKFRMNWTQRHLLDHLWYLNVILKARQLGITTFFCLLYFDDVLFNGLDAGLIAHTLQDATKIFESKIRYAWDNIPQVIRAQYVVDAESVRELRFKKGKRRSSIYVGTSLRSGTVQRLHISELSTIDQKYPDKAEEIKAGALNTVHKGQIVTIESTAKGQIGIFHDFSKRAMDIQRSKKELTEMDYKFFFFPWYRHPEYKLEGDIIIPMKIQEYFTKVEIQMDVKLSEERRNWYYKKYLVQGESMKSEFPSTPEEAFETSTEGAYFEKQMNKAVVESRIRLVPYEPLLQVDTWWDLGTSKARKDSMSIVFTQDVGMEIHIIDFYGSSGEGLAHYIKILQNKKYIYGKHWAPHDIQVRELGTGKTRLEMASQLGINFDVVPKLSFSDGIEATRMVLQKCWFDEEKCDSLIRALKSFRKEWDDKLGKFRDQPLNNWAKDPADAFRMMAVGHKDIRKLGFGLDAEEEELERIKAREREGEFDPFNPFPQI